MSRVFVLGSGFSARAGAPLSRSVLANIFRQDRFIPKVMELKSYIDRFLFPGRPDWVNETDFEEVLSRLDLISHYQPYPNIDYEQVSYYEDLLIDEFTKLLNPEHLAPGHFSYALFKRLLEPQDSIISFNYDLIMESLLNSAGLSYKYCLISQGANPGDNTNSINLLKLHGSLNIFYCPLCSTVYFDNSTTCSQCSKAGKSAALRRFIIAPTLFKSFTVPALRSLWFTALQVLAGASQIYFIGYSLPEADILSYQLFDFARRMSIQNQEVHLITGPKAASDRFRQIYGAQLKNEGENFEQWVERYTESGKNKTKDC